MKRINTMLIGVLVTFAAMIPFSADAWTVYGDVSGGGVLWIDDVTHLIDDILSGQTTIMDDVNGDLKVDMKDLTILIDLLLTGELTFDLYYPPVPDSALVFTANGVSFAMMPVKGGPHPLLRDAEYGDTGAKSDVVLSDFYMGMTEVTVEQWEAVMGDTHPSAIYYRSKPNQPVDMVSYWDCKNFIAKLNELTGLEFRLPTADQWKYAAMGGRWTHHYPYAGSDDLDEVAWYNGNRPELFERYVQLIYPYYNMPVGMKKPNELGLYDMSGNMMERIEHSALGWGEYYEEIDPEDTNPPHTYALGGDLITDTKWLYLYASNMYPFELPRDSAPSCGFRLLLMASSLNR